MSWYLHTWQNDHHDKSGDHLTPKVITVLLTIFIILYIPSLWLIYYVTGDLYLLITFTFFTQPLWPSLVALICSLYICLFSFLFCFWFICFVFWNLHINEIMWYLSFSAWLISWSIILSSSIYVASNGKICFLWPSNIPLYMYHIHLSLAIYSVDSIL